MLPETASARSRLGVASKKAKRLPTAEHLAEVADAKRLFAEAVLAEHIARVVADAPPLTNEQRSRLAVLLNVNAA